MNNSEEITSLALRITRLTLHTHRCTHSGCRKDSLTAAVMMSDTLLLSDRPVSLPPMLSHVHTAHLLLQALALGSTPAGALAEHRDVRLPLSPAASSPFRRSMPFNENATISHIHPQAAYFDSSIA